MKLSLVALRGLGIIGLVAYTLIFGEIFVRLTDPQVLLPRYVTGTPWGVRGNIANAHYWHSTPEVSVEFRINSQGMRADHDYPLSRTAGSCRIALFGDSYFMGYELNLKDTFASRLEERLRADDFNVEVLNFSVSGFGTAEMIRTYEGFANRFAPDVVIFQWHSTDLDDNVRSNLFGLRAGRLESNGNSYLPAVKIQDALMRFNVYRLVADNSHFYSFLRERAADFVQHLLAATQKPAPDTAAATVGSQNAKGGNGQPAIPYTIMLSAALLKHAREITRKEGQDFYVVDIPDRVTRTSFSSTIGAIPGLADLNVISSLAALEGVASPDTKVFFERGHSHLTPTAINALVSVAAPTLEQSTSLQACRTSR